MFSLIMCIVDCVLLFSYLWCLLFGLACWFAVLLIVLVVGFGQRVVWWLLVFGIAGCLGVLFDGVYVISLLGGLVGVFGVWFWLLVWFCLCWFLILLICMFTVGLLVLVDWLFGFVALVFSYWFYVLVVTVALTFVRHCVCVGLFLLL